MNTSTDELPPYVLLRIPSSLELARLVDQVVSDWICSTALHSGKPVPGPAPLSLEYSVLLKGPFRSRLVLRAQPALAEGLARAVGHDSDHEAFKELSHRVARQLLQRFFGGGRASFEAFEPTKSGPAQWPSRMPDAESLLSMDGQLLEARLWIEPAKGAYVGAD